VNSNLKFQLPKEGDALVTVHAVIVNPFGKVIIPQRSNKCGYGKNLLECGFGGKIAVQAKNLYADLFREMGEEAGIKVKFMRQLPVRVHTINDDQARGKYQGKRHILIPWLCLWPDAYQDIQIKLDKEHSTIHLVSDWYELYALKRKLKTHFMPEHEHILKDILLRKYGFEV
jgi:hypothetical protein